MKDQRIGNDLRVKWTLVMKGRYGKKKIEDFTVSGNTLEWTFFGKDQKHTGVYSLILVVNEGAEGMVTTDACNFVNLVSCSCKTGGSDECGIFTETVELTSTIEYLAGGSVTVDTELSETSTNPLANATVTAELKKKVSAVEGMGLSSNDFTDDDKEKLDGLLVIAPTNNAEALKAAFEKYGLAERLHTPIPCFYKENSFDKAYQNAILIVESYPDGYKLNFVNISATSQFKAYDENGNEIGDAFDPEWQWSPKCKFINGECNSYLIQSSGYVMHLGKGEMVIADDKMDESSDRPISNKAFCEALKSAITKFYDDLNLFEDYDIYYPPKDGKSNKIYISQERISGFHIARYYNKYNNKFFELGTLPTLLIGYGDTNVGLSDVYNFITKGREVSCYCDGAIYHISSIHYNPFIAEFSSPNSRYILRYEESDVYPYRSWTKIDIGTPEILYTAQELIEEQKSQARKNIGVDDAIASAITNVLNEEV